MDSQKTIDSLSQAILQRIATGQYNPGDRLPSVRRLAEKIGCSRNTVNNAYHTLCQSGVIEKNETNRMGYRVLNAEGGGSKSKSELLGYFYQHVVELVWQAMAAGSIGQLSSTACRMAANTSYLSFAYLAGSGSAPFA